ncbi:MAG: hypothetical protein KJ906_02535 [Nanoarchaeota archaeon]|nr:hypothetical protein [Nanoarchaeota archaeon]
MSLVLTKKFEDEFKESILDILYKFRAHEYWISQDLLLKIAVSKKYKLNKIDTKEFTSVQKEYASQIIIMISKLEEEALIQINSQLEIKLTLKGKQDCENEDMSPILDGSCSKRIHAALDFNEQAYIGIYLPCKSKDEEISNLCIITDDHEIMPVTESNLKSADLIIESVTETESRWSLDSINDYIISKSSTSTDIFNRIREQYTKYIDFPEEDAYDFFSLWVIGTYLHPLFNSYPYLYTGGIKESGKSKLLYTTFCMTFNSIFSGNMSASAIFRLIQGNRCTLLIDETENLSNPERAMEFRTILLNGYKSGSKIYRVESNKAKQFKVIPFEPYSPKIIANIRGLEDVLESRCIPFILKRTMNKLIGNVEINEKDKIWQEIRNDLYVFTLTNWKDIKETYDNLKNETDLSNRQWELWKPIFSIAYFIDIDLYDKMKILAQNKSKEQQTENTTETGEYILVETLTQLVTSDNYYRIKDIHQKVIEQFDSEQRWLTSTWIGRALRRLGFSEKRRIGGRTEIKLNVDDVINMAERLGIPLQTPQPTQVVQDELTWLPTGCGGSSTCGGAEDE